MIGLLEEIRFPAQPWTGLPGVEVRQSALDRRPDLETVR